MRILNKSKHFIPNPSEIIEKIYLYFPNLQYIFVAGVFAQYINEEICTSILNSCIQLDTFEIGECKNSYVNSVNNARCILTTINLHRLCKEKVFKGSWPMGNYLRRFPRLKKVKGVTHLSTFEKWLPIFQKLPHITEIEIMLESPDSEGFAENFLSDKTEEKKNLTLERLSNIKTLHIQYATKALNVNSLKFISKYMTGFKLVTMKSRHKNQDSLIEDDALKNMLNVITYAECVGSVELKGEIKTRSLETMYQGFLQDSDAMNSGAVKKEFELEITSNRRNPELYTSNDIVQTNIRQSVSKRMIHISLYRVDQFLSIMESIHKSTLNNINSFILHSHRCDIPVAYSMYYKLFRSMHSLGNVPLGLPVVFDDEGGTDFPVWEQSCIKQITLDNAPTDTIFLDPLFTTLSKVAPNLKELRINTSRAYWNDLDNILYINVSMFSLNSLKINLSSVKAKKRFHTCSFFALDVRLLKNSERHLYKVSFDLSTVERIDIPSDSKSIYVEGTNIFVQVKCNTENFFIESNFCQSTGKKGSKNKMDKRCQYISFFVQ